MAFYQINRWQTIRLGKWKNNNVLQQGWINRTSRTVNINVECMHYQDIQYNMFINSWHLYGHIQY